MEFISSYSLLQMTAVTWDMVLLILKDLDDQYDPATWLSCVSKQANSKNLKEWKAGRSLQHLYSMCTWVLELLGKKCCCTSHCGSTCRGSASGGTHWHCIVPPHLQTIFIWSISIKSTKPCEVGRTC